MKGYCEMKLQVGPIAISSFKKSSKANLLFSIQAKRPLTKIPLTKDKSFSVKWLFVTYLSNSRIHETLEIDTTRFVFCFEENCWSKSLILAIMMKLNVKILHSLQV